MHPNNPAQDKKPKHQPTENMKEYLWANAEKIKAEMNAKRQEELEKENFRSDYISKYQRAVSETQSRFTVESKRCNEIFKLIEPTLQEIINFAEQHSIFPPKMEKTPDLLPIQIFHNLNTPRIETNLRLYYSSTNDEIVVQYQNQIANLMQEHVYLDCGVNWGYTDDGETYGSIYGVQMSVLYSGEVKIGEISFGVSELNSKEFKKALSDVFYSPVRIRTVRSNPSLPKNTKDEKESALPISKKLALGVITFLRRIINFWITVWSEPQSEINANSYMIRSSLALRMMVVLYFTNNPFEI